MFEVLCPIRAFTVSGTFFWKVLSRFCDLPSERWNGNHTSRNSLSCEACPALSCGKSNQRVQVGVPVSRLTSFCLSQLTLSGTFSNLTRAAGRGGTNGKRFILAEFIFGVSFFFREDGIFGGRNFTDRALRRNLRTREVYLTGHYTFEPL